MSAPLTRDQKRYLAIQTNKAFELAQGRGEIIEECGCGEGLRTSYRHNLVIKAANKHGLRCCGQSDYNRVKAHFLHLLGEDGAALNAHIRAETEPRRLAEYKLKEACAEFNLPLSYADAICRRQNRGLGMQEVGTKTLWHLFYTIRNRGRRKQAAA